jgi:hypothetical protein
MSSEAYPAPPPNGTFLARHTKGRAAINANPDFSMKIVSQMLGVTRQTVGRWVGDITERRRNVRKVKALLLSRLGWTQGEIAELLEVTQRTVSGDLEEMSELTSLLTEDLLQEALEGLPEDDGELAEVAEYLRTQCPNGRE